MNFDGFRIVMEDDQLTVVLYVDEQQLAEYDEFQVPNRYSQQNQYLTEFAREFSRKSDLKHAVQEDATEFIKSRFPNLKITTVKIMVGKMLLGAFTLSNDGRLGNSPATGNKVQQMVEIEYPINK
jgi:hypothetical protein